MWKAKEKGGAVTHAKKKDHVPAQPARQRPFHHSSNYSLNSSKKSVARDTLGIKRQKSHAEIKKIRLFFLKTKQ